MRTDTLYTYRDIHIHMCVWDTYSVYPVSWPIAPIKNHTTSFISSRIKCYPKLPIYLILFQVYFNYEANLSAWWFCSCVSAWRRWFSVARESRRLECCTVIRSHRVPPQSFAASQNTTWDSRCQVLGMGETWIRIIKYVVKHKSAKLFMT